MAVTAANMQFTYDSSPQLNLNPGSYLLPAPLFMDGVANATTQQAPPVVGTHANQVVLDATQCGTAVVMGWPRGLVSDAHFPANGYRTLADSALSCRGTPFDIGPPGGWSSLTTFALGVTAVRPSGNWRLPTDTGVCGVQAFNEGFTCRPSPYTLTVVGTDVSPLLRLSLRLKSNVIYHFTVPMPLGVTLDCDWDVDLANGVVTATIALQAVAVTGTLPANSSLHDNYRYAFAVGRLAGLGNETGYYLANPLYDATFTRLKVSGSGGFAASMQFSLGRWATYAGGPSLPLLHAMSNGGPVAVFVVAAAQFVGNGGELRNVTIKGAPGNPNVALGGFLNGALIADCVLTGGTRGVTSENVAVTYPVTVRDCTFMQHTDMHLYLCHIAHMVLMRMTMGYAGRRDAVLDNVVGVLADVFSSTPSDTSAECVTQHGGNLTVVRYRGDNEGASPPVVVRLIPGSLELPTWATTLRLIDSFSSADNTKGAPVVEAADTAGYTGKVRIIVDDGADFVGKPTVNNFGAGLFTV